MLRHRPFLIGKLRLHTCDFLLHVRLLRFFFLYRSVLLCQDRIDLGNFLLRCLLLCNGRLTHPLDVRFALGALILPPLDVGLLLSEYVQFLLLSAELSGVLLHTPVNQRNVRLERILFLLSLPARTHLARLLITMLVQCLHERLLLPQESLMLLHKRGKLIFPPLLIELTKLHRFFRLHGKRLKLRCLGIHDIVQANEIALVLTQFAQSFLLPRAVLRDARRLLEEHTALLGTTVQDVIQSILSDDAHAIVPDSRIRKELIDVLDTAARIIQIDFAVAVSIKTTLHDDLIVVDGQFLIRIVKDQHNLGNTECTSGGRARKNNVLRAQPAQHTNILLAQNPANGVRNIAFAAPIRSNDCSDPLIELDDNPLGE